MRTRAIKDGNVVWFGSCGKDENDKAIFYDKNKNSFSSGAQGVQDSLLQRLSILEKEIWYRISYGVPIFDKVHSKTLIDNHVASVITSHPDVLRIEKFESHVINHKYYCDVKIISKFGKIAISM